MGKMLMRIRESLSIVMSFFVFCASVNAADVVNKKYREQFLTDGANRNYYRNQMRVADFFSRQTSAVNGLVESFRGTSIYSYDIFTNSFAYGRGGGVRCAILYLRRSYCRYNLYALRSVV
ncbi:exported protein of unknown function [Endomicrobium proavitum]|uniref:Uncharacterized protein n=1 Tax=Endomicrobium proavitum TaxID=1408281 RepID=A0A0G3WH91_9BACT|nr:exported protein of unknown function [Endomicrobium proavitum]